MNANRILNLILFVGCAVNGVVMEARGHEVSTLALFVFAICFLIALLTTEGS